MSEYGYTGLQSLPPLQIVEEIDFDVILSGMRDYVVAQYPELVGIIDIESEPARIVLRAVAYQETVLRARINDAIRANFLAYASGTDLDNLSYFYEVERMGGEDDEHLRERTILAISGRSTGGTEPRYKFVAMTADIRVKDALAYTLGTNPTVYLAVFSTESGGIAAPDLLAIVDEAVQSSSVRMVNDTIVVRSAITTEIAIEANIWMLPQATGASFDGLEQALRDAWDAESKVGFDMTLSWLQARLMRPGVQRVEIATPTANVVLPPYEGGTITTVTLNNMGRDF